MEFGIRNKLLSKSKKKYILDRIFLPDENLRSGYPFFYKHKILLPILVIYRLIKALTSSRKKVLEELSILKRSNRGNQK